MKSAVLDDPASLEAQELSDPTLATLASALAGIMTLWLIVLALHLTPALFAALVTYGGTRALARLLERWRPAQRHTQAWGLVLLLLMIGVIGLVLVGYAVDTAETGGGYAALLHQMAHTLEQLHQGLPSWLAAHLPTSLDALHGVAVTWLRDHVAQLQLWGGHTLRGVGYVLIGMVIGGLLVLQLPVNPAEAHPQSLTAAARREFDRLVQSFTAVVFAQLRIATLNTALTALYLLGVLPLLGMPLPLPGTLLALTFTASLLPVVGNLISNTVILIVSLRYSVPGVLLSLAWLVAIHKLEYFLNAHIMGHRIRAHAWELLTAMLVLQAMFGLGGLVGAPVLYAQIKQALHERGWLDWPGSPKIRPTLRRLLCPNLNQLWK